MNYNNDEPKSRFNETVEYSDSEIAEAILTQYDEAHEKGDTATMVDLASQAVKLGNKDLLEALNRRPLFEHGK